MTEHVKKILSSKEYLLTHVLNEMSDMIVIQDLEFNIVWANKVAYKEARLANYIPKDNDILGKPCYHIFHGLDHPCINCAILKSIQSKSPQMVEKYDESKNKWFLYNVYPIFEDGRMTRLAYISSDITEKKRMEYELRENYQLLKSILENIGVSINTADKNGILLSYNKGSEEIFGWRSGEVMGKHISIFHREEDRDTLVPQILEEAKEKGKYSGITILIKKSGKEFLASLIVTPIFDSKNEIKAYIGIARELG
ncbi:MAG: PAS domain-containing protein [Candidatus Helarchaeota archaeon]